MKVLFSIISLQELESIKAYIKRDSEQFARIFIEKILSTIKRLEDFPFIGRIVPEINRQEIRELIYRDYRIIYKCKDNNVIILTVIHGSRLLIPEEKGEWIIM